MSEDLEQIGKAGRDRRGEGDKPQTRADAIASKHDVYRDAVQHSDSLTQSPVREGANSRTLEEAINDTFDRIKPENPLTYFTKDRTAEGIRSSIDEVVNRDLRPNLPRDVQGIEKDRWTSYPIVDVRPLSETEAPGDRWKEGDDGNREILTEDDRRQQREAFSANALDVIGARQAIEQKYSERSENFSAIKQEIQLLGKDIESARNGMEEKATTDIQRRVAYLKENLRNFNEQMGEDQILRQEKIAETKGKYEKLQEYDEANGFNFDIHDNTKRDDKGEKLFKSANDSYYQISKFEEQYKELGTQLEKVNIAFEGSENPEDGVQRAVEALRPERVRKKRTRQEENVDDENDKPLRRRRRGN